MADEKLNYEGWEIDFSTWRQKDKAAWHKAEVDAANDGEEERLYPFFARCVKKWPHPTDPAIPDNYGEMLLSDYQGVVKRVRERLKSYLA